MCRGERTCIELGNDAAKWSKLAPLMPPVWFGGELTLFAEAVRLASVGDVAGARIKLGSIQSEQMQTWFIEHGQQSGFFRDRHFHLATPPITIPLDPLRSPDKLATEVFKRDGYRCRFCGNRLVPLSVLKEFSKAVGNDDFRATGTNMERHGIVLAFRANADHVVPWTLGGRTDMANIVSACWSCNFGKSSYTLEQLGLGDPRDRPIPISDGWNGLTSFIPSLRANAQGKS